MAILQQCYVIGLITGGVRSLKAENFAAEGVRFFGTKLKHVSVAKPALEAESSLCSCSAINAVLRVRCMVPETKPSTEKKTVLHDFYDQQCHSPWYDNLSLPVIDLIPFIKKAIQGVTSNPTIFVKAISDSTPMKTNSEPYTNPILVRELCKAFQQSMVWAETQM